MTEPAPPPLERFAHLVLEAMADGVFTLDREGRVTSWNPAMTRITGYPAAEVMGRPCSILGFNRCLGRQCPTGAMDCGIFDRGAVDAKECHLRHRDGHEAPVLKSARLIRDDRGEIIGVVETVTDMSELRRPGRPSRRRPSP